MKDSKEENISTASLSLKNLMQRLKYYHREGDECPYPYASIQSSKDLEFAAEVYSKRADGARGSKRHTQSFSGFSDFQGHFFSKLHLLRKFHQISEKKKEIDYDYDDDNDIDDDDDDDYDAGIFEMSPGEEDFSDDYERFDLETIYGQEYRPSATSGVVSDSSDNDHPFNSNQEPEKVLGSMDPGGSLFKKSQLLSSADKGGSSVQFCEETSASSLNYSNSSSLTNVPVTTDISVQAREDSTAIRNKKCSTAIFPYKKLARFMQRRPSSKRHPKGNVNAKRDEQPSSFHDIKITIQDEEGNFQAYNDNYDILEPSRRQEKGETSDADEFADDDDEKSEDDRHGDSKSKPLLKRRKNLRQGFQLANRFSIKVCQDKSSPRSGGVSLRKTKQILGNLLQQMKGGLSLSLPKPILPKRRGDQISS